jgi:flagellar FliL protein
MSKKDKAKSEDKDAKAGKAGKGKAIGLAVGFAVLGAVAGPKLLGTGAAPAGATEDTTTTTAAGPVVVLDPVTLNLADGHMLQVGLALELSPDVESGAGHGEAPADDDPTRGFAKALDATISVLGEQSMAALSAPGGRDHAKAALETALHDLYHGEIVGVYFHQFVMQ